MTKARKFTDSGWYHVFNRGSRRWPIYQDDIDRRLFYDQLRSMTENVDVKVHSFCLMGNHYHLVVRAEPEELSAGMALLSGGYTREFNNRHRADGPLFRGRFKSVPIASDSQLLQTVAYVALNPKDLLKAGEPLNGYQWSSHPVYCGFQDKPLWLTTSFMLEIFGGFSGYQAYLDSEMKRVNKSQLPRGINTASTPGYC